MTLLVFRPFGSLIQSRRQLVFRLFLGHCFQFGDQGCILDSVGLGGEQLLDGGSLLLHRSHIE